MSKRQSIVLDFYNDPPAKDSRLAVEFPSDISVPNQSGSQSQQLTSANQPCTDIPLILHSSPIELSKPDENLLISANPLIQEQISVPLLNLTKTYPTDPAQFVHTVHTIVNYGPCQPGIGAKISFFLSIRKTGVFIPVWYYNKLPKGFNTQINWLIYSPKFNAMFCHPCWLFANNANKSYDPTWSNPSFRML